MELLLNSIWLALVAGASFTLLRAYRVGVDQRRFLLAVGALLCAAALLFPAISITDDLHFDAFVVEDASSTKRLGHAMAHTAPVARVAWFWFALLSLRFVSLQRSWRPVESLRRSHKLPLLIRPVLGRAPPTTFLA